MVSFVSHSLNKINPLIILQRREKWRRFPGAKRPSQWCNSSFTCSTYSFPLGIIKTALLSQILKMATPNTVLLLETLLSPHLIPEWSQALSSHQKPSPTKVCKLLQEKTSAFKNSQVKFISLASPRIHHTYIKMCTVTTLKGDWGAPMSSVFDSLDLFFLSKLLWNSGSK